MQTQGKAKHLETGVNFKFSWNSFTLASEGVTGKELDIPFKGFYTDLFYSSQMFCPVLRFEYLDTSHLITKIYNAGISYKLLESKAKLQLNYAYLDNATTDFGSPKTLIASKGSLLIANLQLSF